MRDESQSELHVVSLEDESNSDIEMREVIRSSSEGSAFEEYRRQMPTGIGQTATSYDGQNVVFNNHDASYNADRLTYEVERARFEADAVKFDEDHTDANDAYSEAENTLREGFGGRQNLSNSNDS